MSGNSELSRRDYARATELRRCVAEISRSPDLTHRDAIVAYLLDAARWWEKQATALDDVTPPDRPPLPGPPPGA